MEIKEQSVDPKQKPDEHTPTPIQELTDVESMLVSGADLVDPNTSVKPTQPQPGVYES